MLSDETVAIPPQKWHLIATTFKTNTRKGQFADLPGRSGTFADFRLTSAAFLGAQTRSPDLRFASPAFAGADVGRPSADLGGLCGG